MNDITRGADIEIDAALYEQIKKEAASVVSELFEQITIKQKDILVIGCSSSEVVGESIGKGSSYYAARALFDAIYPITQAHDVYLAIQCCEHLNRALIIERECAEKYGYEEVTVIPQPKAGGSLATVAYESFSDPVVVEKIKAHTGIDIGGTLIGMHLRDVAVPIRLSRSKIGCASIICAYTRHKYIGGERAVYK